MYDIWHITEMTISWQTDPVTLVQLRQMAH